MLYGTAVTRIESIRTEPLASHHFLLEADVLYDIPARLKLARVPILLPEIAESFAKTFEEAMPQKTRTTELDVDALATAVTNSLRLAESKCLPELRGVKKKPWISERTLDLIQRRSRLRSQGLVESEKQLTKEIQRSASSDRRTWLCELACSGD